MIIDKKRDKDYLGASAFSVNILLIIFSFLTFQQLVNASCILPDGQRGSCVTFERCHSAAVLSKRGVAPVFCSLEEGLVCCADDKNSETEKRSLSGFQKSPQPEWLSEIYSTAQEAIQALDIRRKRCDVFINNYNNGKRNVNARSIKQPLKAETQNFDYAAVQDDVPDIRRENCDIFINNYGPGKRNVNARLIEEPYKFETPNVYYSGVDYTEKPIRRSSHSKNEQAEDNTYFVPPGLAMKKSWREEKTTENNYYFEHITRKPARGPNRRGPNKNTGGNSRKSEDRGTTRIPEWSDQERKRTTDDYYYHVQNGYQNGFDYFRPTTGGNTWEHETYTTRRPEFHNNGGGYNHAENENEYSNVKPPRRPNRPNAQGSQNQGNKKPNHHKGPQNQGNKRPGHQQGSYNQGNKRPIYQEGTNFEGSQPNYQQGFNYEGNRPSSRPGSQNNRRISEQKCEEYSKLVTENITGLPLTTNPNPVVISFRKCATPQQLIVGGENTTLGEFPHMAAIGFKDSNKKKIVWLCGGTLISEQYVMTAAHCSSTSSGRPVKVRLGEYNLRQNDDGAHPVEYAVVDIVTHPEYRPPSKYNDIALLKLSRRVTFSRNIRPACLYTEDTVEVPKAIATGWGRTNYDGESSDVLQKVVLSIVDSNTCNRFYKVNGNTGVLSRGIIDSQICAGEITGGKDTCQGDSGGPLSISSTKCIHHIIGITSFGKSCALPNSSGVYTKVSAFVPWIENIIWETNYN